MSWVAVNFTVGWRARYFSPEEFRMFDRYVYVVLPGQSLLEIFFRIKELQLPIFINMKTHKTDV